MADRGSGLAGGGIKQRQARRSARSSRASILATAKELFSTRGYAATSISDIVAAAGTSVGLPYYYFGSKANIFLAIYREYQGRQHARTSSAVASAEAGGASGVELLAVGVRAYLEGAWVDRDVIPLIHGRDVPPELQEVMESGGDLWSDQMLWLLPTLEKSAAKRCLILLSDSLSAASFRVSTSSSPAEAEEWVHLAVTMTRSLLHGVVGEA
ncbi:MAG: helix-turn-helix domain containing protein [Actinomycetota bacterium]|nr:helix-turn-helix domain containing protein [Actinomycetota bacterium]